MTYSKDNTLYLENQASRCSQEAALRSPLTNISALAAVPARVRWRFLAREQAGIVNRLSCHRLQRDYSGPGRKRIVRFIVDWRTDTHFRGEFFYRHAQHRRCFQFAVVGLARVVPAAGQNVL